MWRVVDYAEGVNQIIRLWRNESAELFRIARTKEDAVFQTEHGSAPAGQLHRFVGKAHSGDLRPSTGKINRVRADPAPDFQHLFAPPAPELRKSRTMILHDVSAFLHLVTVFLRSHARGPMPHVSRTS